MYHSMFIDQNMEASQQAYLLAMAPVGINKSLSDLFILFENVLHVVSSKQSGSEFLSLTLLTDQADLVKVLLHRGVTSARASCDLLFWLMNSARGSGAKPGNTFWTILEDCNIKK